MAESHTPRVKPIKKEPELDFPDKKLFSGPVSIGLGTPIVVQKKDYWYPYFDRQVELSHWNTVVGKTIALLELILSSNTTNVGIYAPNILELALHLPKASDPREYFFETTLGKFEFPPIVSNEEAHNDKNDKNHTPTLSKHAIPRVNVDPVKPQRTDQSDGSSSDSDSSKGKNYDPVSKRILKSLSSGTPALYVGPILCCALLGGASRQAASTASRIVRLLKTLPNFFPRSAPVGLTEADQQDQEWVNKIKDITNALRGGKEYRQFAAVCVAATMHSDTIDGAYKAIKMCALMLYHREGYQVSYFLSKLADRYSVDFDTILTSCAIGSILPDVQKVLQYMRNFANWVKTNSLENDEVAKQSYYYCRAVNENYDGQLSGSITWRLQALLARWIDHAEKSRIYEISFEQLRDKKLSETEDTYAFNLYLYYEKYHNLEGGTEMSRIIQSEFGNLIQQARAFSKGGIDYAQAIEDQESK